MPTGSEIRRKFLDFFVQKGHREVHSSSLVPQNDPTLLFTNAGMNQFKDIFLGLEKRDYNKATTSQKCVRAGGKHNDLENVGFTNRHHTFFEMLGNFSFGDYFKKDAIAYAWELITSPQWFGIDKSKLYVTIFNGEGGMQRDVEAYDLWIGQGVPKDRIFEFGLKDNFWQMGDTGPCGPCSEIHYDMGVIASDQSHADCAFGCDCGRYVELWNLVFMQFDRDASSRLNPLPKPSIDTGMGLERVTALLQGVISNYDTDLFTPLIGRAARLCGVPNATQDNFDYHNLSGLDQASLRIIADHSRAATFLAGDGVVPSNEGRGYVLRKIIRRAETHGRLLGMKKPFMNQMTHEVKQQMMKAYPELSDIEPIARVIGAEEVRFARTIDLGLKEWRYIVDAEEYQRAEVAERHIKDNETADEAAQKRNNPEEYKREFSSRLQEALKQMPPLQVPGDSAFKLYDTFGLPLDFMVEAARDQGITLDLAGFDRAMQEQRERARASWKGTAKQTANPIYRSIADGTFFLSKEQLTLFQGLRGASVEHSVFEGYRQTRSNGCDVLAIIHDGQGEQELKPGEQGEIILDHTPFYAESGGQVGDRGWLYSDDHNTIVAEVRGCYYPVQGVRAHQVVAKQPIRVGQKVDAVVDTEIRQATMRNHTATHLLQAGLREVLGKHVKQTGSLVAPNHLRFDFSHFTAVADEELQDIEDLINKEVLSNQKIEVIENVPIDVAINEYKAMALFGEKYGDQVRVIKIGDFSTELCGGTHTGATGEIGLIKVLKESSVSSGNRRIEAITGMGSVNHFRRDHALEKVVRSMARIREDIPLDHFLRQEIEIRDEKNERLRHELERERMKIAVQATAKGKSHVRLIRDVKVLTTRIDNLERSQLRELVDKLRNEIGSGVVVLGSATNGNVSLIVGVTKDLTSKIQAGKVIGPVAQKVGGKGGGRPDLAEAGGKDPAQLDAALGEVYGVVEGLLGN